MAGTRDFENYLSQIQTTGRAQQGLNQINQLGVVAKNVGDSIQKYKEINRKKYDSMIEMGFEPKVEDAETFNKMMAGEDVNVDWVKSKKDEYEVTAEDAQKWNKKNVGTFKVGDLVSYKTKDKLTTMPDVDEANYFGDSKTRKIYDSSNKEVTDDEVLKNINFNKDVKWATGISDMAVAREKSIAQRYEFKDRDQMVKLEGDISALTKSGQNVISQAGKNNVRAFRLLKTMDDPTATPQEQQLAIADLAAIYKGGVPDQQLMNDTEYKTIKGTYAKFMEYLTSNPQEINTPEIRSRLKKITQELIDIDNKMIESNIGQKGLAYMPLLNKLQKGEVNHMTPEQQRSWWDSLSAGAKEVEAMPGTQKQGGQVMIDAKGNKAIVYPDGTFEEVK